jgi:hypothetical protein
MQHSYRPTVGGYATAEPNVGVIIVRPDKERGWTARHSLLGIQSMSRRLRDQAVDEVVGLVRQRIIDVAAERAARDAVAVATVQAAQSEYMAARRIAPTLTYAETQLLWEAMQQYVVNCDGTPPPGAEALRNRLDTLMLGFMSVPPLPGVIA